MQTQVSVLLHFVLVKGVNYPLRNIGKLVKARLKKSDSKASWYAEGVGSVSSTNKPDAQLFKHERHYWHSSYFVPRCCTRTWHACRHYLWNIKQQHANHAESVLGFRPDDDK